MTEGEAFGWTVVEISPLHSSTHRPLQGRNCSARNRGSSPLVPGGRVTEAAALSQARHHGLATLLSGVSRWGTPLSTSRRFFRKLH